MSEKETIERQELYNPEKAKGHLTPVSNSNDKQDSLKKLMEHHTQNKNYLRLKDIYHKLEDYHLKYLKAEYSYNRQININNKELINFSSFNYLGLDQDIECIEAAKQAADTHGLHTGTSRVFHSSKEICELEKQIADVCQQEDSLVFVNVSQVHQGTLPALWGNEDSTIFIDRFAHASMQQAALIAKANGAKIKKVNASDTESLNQCLLEDSAKFKVLLTDGLHSMHGHLLPLKKIQQVCIEHSCTLYLDDAHGFGVLGETGAGTPEACNLSNENLILVGSLHKSLGTFGAFITGNQLFIEFLKFRASTYMFSGSIQPSAIKSAKAALKISSSHRGKCLRKKIQSHAEKIRNELNKANLDVLEGEAPVVSIKIGNDLNTLLAGKFLFDQGLYVNSVLYPAVPKNEGLLRISLSALHSHQDVEKLIKGFKKLKNYLSKKNNKFSKVSLMGKIAIKQFFSTKS